MNYWKRIAIGILVFTVSHSSAHTAGAGDITGFVKDLSTGEYVRNVPIIIPELNLETKTDEKGTFTFTRVPDGTYTVRISGIGYESVSRNVTVNGSARMEFLLEQKPFVTEEIVSTARGRETRLDDIPGSVEVVTDTDFLESNPVSIPVALSRKPGISVNSEMPWSSRPVIRGLTKDQIILLVDGCRVVTATATAAQFGTIANGDIERIEVLKGPISVLYGSGSTGGVVNVITRKGHFTPGPSYSFGINPTYESGANGLSVYERAGWQNSWFYMGLSQSNRRYTDYRAADGLRIPNSQFEDRQTQVNLGFKLSERHVLEGRYQYFSVLDAGLPGAASFPKNALATYPTTSRMLADVTWTWRPRAAWLQESRFNAYYQPVDRNVKIIPNSPPTDQTNPLDDTQVIRMTPMVLYPEADHLVSGARWQNNIVIGSHNIVAGMEGWQKHMTSDRTRIIQKEIIDKTTGARISEPETITIKDTPVPESWQRPAGIFAEDAFEPGKRTKITLGGRIDQIHTENKKAYMTYQPPSDVLLWDERRDNDVSWSFVAGGIHTITEGIDLNLTVARSFRSPTLEERYLYADLGGKLTVGDPEIDPEKGTFI